MRIVTTLTEQMALTSSTAAEQMHAQRERQAAQLAHAIISTKEELPRNRLEFGRYWIEDTETGAFFTEFGGDPSYTPNVHHYYVRSDSVLVMLEPADPPSRAEMERRQARKEQRRAEREAAGKERYKQLRKAAK